ncbi:putative mediator of RNA polymerase II transcription subunit 26b [Acorus calamus]|uniref:Mediator of RNA polymerase II transcription subunit 26b n=1 Tax=Acorus calamus TaxID=4465 RepID=A0AAV9CX34_ACOCL|nr:putative mediator of RNA polymerase II transcription subunit 26b [Acorus calamus]
MVVKSGTLDDWRDYFRSANSDIFDVIEQAILIAASDYPNEFRSRRDRIAERLFSARLTRCIGCDRVELAVPVVAEGDEKGSLDDGGEGDDGVGGRGGGGGSERSAKESKVNSSTIDQEEKLFHKSIYSYDEAEALTDEMEEETQMVGEVLRIREVLEQKNDESESTLFDSLRRLEIMQLSVDTLKATEIGKAVNGLRKHNSKRIRHLVRTLIDGWKDLVDAWVSSTAAIAETTPDSINPSVLDEELGLPFPPLDEGALLATQTAPMELSKFFDGMDDDGNPRNGWEFDKNQVDGRKFIMEDNKTKKHQISHVANIGEEKITRKPEVIKSQAKPLSTGSGLGKPLKDQMIRQTNIMEDKGQMRREPMNMETKLLNNGSGPGRPLKPGSVTKANLELKSQHIGIQKKERAGLQEKPKTSEEALKLEIAKRKLHEGYQLAENAKKQRTIQVMELRDLPKQGLPQRHTHVKPGMQNRYRPNVRR